MELIIRAGMLQKLKTNIKYEKKVELSSVRRNYSPDHKQRERVYKSTPNKILLLLAM